MGLASFLKEEFARDFRCSIYVAMLIFWDLVIIFTELPFAKSKEKEVLQKLLKELRSI